MENKKDKWSALSMQERADLIKLYTSQGITDLMSMKKHYNGIPYADFNTSEYDYFNASPDMEPKKEGEHWGSRNPYTGQILKREDHPTFDLAVEGENKAGYAIRRGIDGNLYSLPQQPYNYVEQNKFTNGGQKQTMNQASSAVAKKAFSKENVGGTIASGLGTAMTLVDNAMKNAEVDTSEADNALEATKSFQTDNSSLDALASSYNSAPWANTNVNFKDFVPGAGTQAMNALSSVTSGMSSGASMGGPWGAIAGAAIGLGSALAGTFAGRAKAKKEEARLEAEATLANQSLKTQAAASRDALLQQQANQNLMNIAAYGGRINKYGDGTTDKENPYQSQFMFAPESSSTKPSTPAEEIIALMQQPTIPDKPQKVNPFKFEDITSSIIDGVQYLYHDSPANRSYYKDDNNRYYMYDGEPLNTEYLTRISHEDIQKLLPKRDYIGGSKRDVGLKVINKIPGLKDEILKLSKTYGISPDVFTQRLINEGWLQHIAQDYNTNSVAVQKIFPWKDFLNDEINGYESLGLDTFGDHLKAGDLNLRRKINYTDIYNANEDDTGNVYNSGLFKNAYDALEAKAAMIEYFTKIGKSKGYTGSDLDAWVNAAYNMGEHNKKLNDIDFVRKRYGFTPYYQTNTNAFGGKMNRFDNGGYKNTYVSKRLLDGTENAQTLSGEELIPEKLLTEEEFINNKRQEIINTSYFNSLHRDKPTVPMILDYSEDDFYMNRDARAKIALENALAFQEGSEKHDWWMKEVDRIKNEKYKARLISGNSCIYTATDNYGKKYRCASNEKFYNLNDYERGFKQIDVNELQPGDLVMDGKGHMLTFDSYDKDGTMLFNYSNGGDHPESIKIKNRYTGRKRDDDNLTYYRFIGDQKDNDQWKKEYFDYKKDYHRRLYEGLSAVNAAKILELPQQAIMMSPESGIITTRKKPEQKLLTKKQHKKVK